MSPFQQTMLNELQGLLERLQLEQWSTTNPNRIASIQMQIDNVKERISLYTDKGH